MFKFATINIFLWRISKLENWLNKEKHQIEINDVFDTLQNLIKIKRNN